MTLEPLVRRLQRLVVRTQTGLLRPLWALGHFVIIRAVARRLTAGVPRARVYLKGGFGFGHPLYGLSDVDMAIVVPGDGGTVLSDADDAASRAAERWTELKERYPPLAQLFNQGDVWIWRADDAAALRHDSYLTFGLRGGGPDEPAAFLGAAAPKDPMALLDHPGLFGPQRDWRALGARRRPPAPAGDPDERALYAWLELRFIWGYAFRTCADPTQASAAYTCVKLVADSARVWLFLVHGEQIFDRTQALRRARQLLREEELTLTWALALHRRLRQGPEPPLAETLPFLVRTSARVAGHLSARARETESTRVLLRWEQTGRSLPLVDWRSRAIPGRIDEEFTLRQGDPGDPVALADACRASQGPAFPALRAAGLLVLPTTEIWRRGRLRGVECEVSDPVSFALLAGDEQAVFPSLPGWSAEDGARRAVAEHRAWLAGGPASDGNRLPSWAAGRRSPSLVELHGLFGAARASLFADSLQRGRPELALTSDAAAAQLVERRPEAAGIVAAAHGELLKVTVGGAEPDTSTVARLRELVCDLAPYRHVPHRRRSPDRVRRTNQP